MLFLHNKLFQIYPSFGSKIHNNLVIEKYKDNLE